MTREKVLVTGSAGHLGDALARVLRGHGYEVVGLDLLASPSTTVVGSITERALVRDCLSGVNAVLHTATLHKPHVGSHGRQAFVDTNVTGTLVLLEESAAAGIGCFVFTSSTSVFGRALTPPPGAPAAWITEEVVPVPRNIYGVTKAAAENLAEIVYLEHGLPVIILRTSRFFPEPDDVAGVRDAYADANIKANEFLYRRADLQDVADAHLRAMERAPRLGFGRYIISATTPFSPADLAGLGTDAPAVAHRLFPDLAAEYARRGWRMFPRIDRVLRQRAGPRRPGLGPALRLPLGAGPAAGGRGAAQPADPCRGRQGLPRRDHRRLHGSLTPAGLSPAPRPMWAAFSGHPAA